MSKQEVDLEKLDNPAKRLHRISVQARSIISWPRVERVILLFTFLLTAVATAYSVRTASTSLKLASSEMRPWITMPFMRTRVDTESIELLLEIENVGNIPAYYVVEHTTYLDGNPTKKPAVSHPPFALMPGQTFNYTALTIQGEDYQAILKNEFSRELKCTTRIRYDVVNKDTGKYYTYLEYTFNASKMPVPPKSKDLPGIWPITKSEFQ